MPVFSFCPASLLLPLRPTFLTFASSQLLFMWMVLSSSVFVQSFIVFPSHIPLQFQSYHQFSSLHPISIPAPHLILLSFENLFQIPPILLRKTNFLSLFMPFIHRFVFPPPTQLGLIPSLTGVPTISPQPSILMCLREIMFGAPDTKAVCF